MFATQLSEFNLFRGCRRYIIGVVVWQKHWWHIPRTENQH